MDRYQADEIYDAARKRAEEVGLIDRDGVRILNLIAAVLNENEEQA